MNQNYTLGRGKLYFSPFIVDTQIPSGYRYIGNTPEFNLTIESENLDHFSSDAGIREKDDSVPLEVNRTGSFVTDSINPENIAHFFFGSNSQVVVVGDSVVDEPVLNVQLGHTYQLGFDEDTNPVGNRGVSNISLGGAAAVKASKAGTFSGAGTANDTITIGVTVYTLKAAPAAANEVLIGGTAALTAYNLEQAINLGDGIGVLYGAGTVAHPDVTAQSAAAVVTVTAKVGGVAGNAIALDESGTGFSWAGAAVFLSGGVASGGVAAATNYDVDLVNGLITIKEDAADITPGTDIDVSYDFSSQTREQILSGSEPVEGALMYIANNPKGHDFNYILPWVKLTPNGDVALKGDEWQQIPMNVEVLKKTDGAAIYVDGAVFVR